MHWKKHTNSINVLTPAKLNLFLEVHGKRNDGFHELDTVITSVDRYDRLTIELTDSDTIDLSCEWDPELDRLRLDDDCFGDLPVAADNLVFRTAELFRRDQKIDRGLRINLMKSIPSQAGLGGASSNAAGALIGLDQLLETGLSASYLSELSARLGSDIPYFVETGFANSASARCTGRGEQVTQINIPQELHFVVVKPPFGLSTKEIFSILDPARIDPCEIDLEVIQQPDFDWSRHLFNRLQKPAEKVSNKILEVCEFLNQSGCQASQMTGSGSCCFGLCQSSAEAQQIAELVEAAGIGFAFTCQKIVDFSVPF